MTDPGQHIRAIDDQAIILGATYTLKCVLMLGTFKDEALDMYMNLPITSISIYLDLVWKMNQFFLVRKQGESLINTPFNNRMGLVGHARE